MDVDTVRFEKGPVFVVGNVKSGTTLLQSLLDGHTDLCVIPVELKFFKFTDLPTIPPSNKPPGFDRNDHVPLPRRKKDIEQIKKDILKHADVKKMLGGENVGRNVNIPKKELNRERFIEVIHSDNPDTVRGLYVLFLKAFHVATGYSAKFEKTCFVEKTPNNEEYAKELRNWFPNSFFIHLLRNPYANIYSLRKKSNFHTRLKFKYENLAKSLYFMERNNRYIERYYVSKYENVVLDTEKEMKRVCSLCKIEYEKETMRCPTVLGQKWKGNSRSVQSDFDGIDPRPVDAYKGELSSFDKFMINKMFANIACKYDYDVIDCSKFSKWIPLPWEEPYTYCKNRMFACGSI